jgi:predicted lipid-binding transport protein (Tim44 family)
MNLRSTGIAAIAAFALTTMADADAARLGGGKSFGAQRPSVAPRASAPPATTPPGAASQPVMPAQPGATLPAKPATAAPAAAPSGASRWLGPIAGLAAGLGLAALLSHFGLPEGFGSFLLLALLVIGGVFVVRMLLARRSPPAQRPLAYAGSQGPAAAPATFEMPPAPAWGGAPRIEPVLAPAAPVTAKPLPAGFDADGFVRHAKLQFVRLQSAHDLRDRAALADVMTPEMYAEVARDLDGSSAGPATEVVTLQAELLEVETEVNRHWASVRFTGTMREGASGAIHSFDEVWNLTKPADGSSGWLLAGIQQPA